MKKRTFCELKRLAREYLTGNYRVPVLAALLAGLLPTFVLAPFSSGVTYRWDSVTATYLAAALIIEVLAQLLAAGTARIHLRLADKQQVSLSDVFWVFRNQPDRFILGTLTLMGAFFIPLAPAIAGALYFGRMHSAYKYFWLGLLALALIVVEIYLAFMFHFIYLLYLDDPQMKVLEGFSKSRELMKGNKMRFFMLQLSFIGWRLLGLASLGVGLLWIGPYITQTTTNFYLDLTGKLDVKAGHIDVVAAGPASALL